MGPDAGRGLDTSGEAAENGLERIAEHINAARLRIKELKEKGVNEETLPEIYECYEECEKIAKKHKIETDIIYEHALFLYNQKDYEKALEKAKWLEVYYDLEEDTGDYEKSKLYNLLGILYSDTHHYTEAEERIKKAIEIRERLASENPSAYERDLAESYVNLGELYTRINRYTEAEEWFCKATGKRG